VLFTCYSGDPEDARLRAAFGSLERCEEVLLAPRARTSGLLVAQIDAVRLGEARVDRNRGGICVDQGIARCLRDLGLSRSDSCRKAVVGNRELGESCFSDVSCTADAYCDQSENACPGTCNASKVAGSACTRDAECATVEGSLVRCADDGSGTSTCQAVAFPSAAAAGAACGNTEAAGCAADLYCDARTSPATCQAPAPVGTPCEQLDDVCVGGALCAGSEGNRACTAIALVRTEGTPCSGTPDAPAMCDALAGYACRGDTCRATGDGTQGSPCDTSDLGDLVSCEAGLYCKQESDTCEDRVAEGAACDRSGMCQSGSCDREQGICRSRYCEI
jgi:hypothetical protein